MTENIYQGLRQFMPASGTLGGDDERSIHFLSFPQVREEYLDPVIQRRFAAMQSVISLTRIVRERNTLPIRTPLKELVVFHSDQQYLDDVKSLSGYIEEELNISELTLTSDETASGVTYRLEADWPVLGRKLRKDAAKVRKGLEKTTSAETKEYAATGKITVEGIDLEAGDLRVVRNVNTAGLEGKWDSNTDGQVVVLLDTAMHEHLQDYGMARELVNRIQRLRKKAGLQATDEVDAFYGFEQGMKSALADCFENQADYFMKVIRRKPLPVQKRPEGKDIIIEEEQAVGDDKFGLSLVYA